MQLMKRRVIVTLALSLFAAASAWGVVEVDFLYRLSNFSGVVPYSAVPIHADRYHDEVYV